MNDRVANRNDARNWIIRRQLGRPNATEDQNSYYRGKRHQGEKKKPHRPSKAEKGHHGDALKTKDKLAKEYDVAPATIERDTKYRSESPTAEPQLTPPEAGTPS